MIPAAGLKEAAPRICPRLYTVQNAGMQASWQEFFSLVLDVFTN
jgi:hypothetical protein